VTGKWANPLTLPGKTLLFLVLSGLATGASWVCYFRVLTAVENGDAGRSKTTALGGVDIPSFVGVSRSF